MQPGEETEGKRLSTFGKVMLALAVPFILVFGFYVYSAIELAIELRNTAATRATLDACRVASSAFQKNLGRWPVALPELINNTNGQVFFVPPAGGFVDGWGMPIVYVRPVGTNGGMIVSFGRDRVPGGTGRDADITVRLP